MFRVSKLLHRVIMSRDYARRSSRDSHRFCRCRLQKSQWGEAERLEELSFYSTLIVR